MHFSNEHEIFWEVETEFYYLMLIHFPCSSPTKQTLTFNLLHNIYYLFIAATYSSIWATAHSHFQGATCLIDIYSIYCMKSYVYIKNVKVGVCL